MKEKIILAAIGEFSTHGLNFTMDDVAAALGISKKTIYKVFKSKEDLLLGIADYCFTDIKRSEQEVLADPNLDITEKIRNIIIVLPERYRNIGLSNLYKLKEKEPRVYKKVEKYLQTDWDATILLLESGMAQGKIKRIKIPILKAMIESTISAFFGSDVLIENDMTYEQGLNEMIDIIMEGITVKGEN